MKKNCKKTSFSLIELLSVMGISVILMAIAIPAFNTITKGENVEIAARTIGSQLKAVRSYAITNRKYVALIIPTTEADLPSNYYYKTYRAGIVSSSNVFQSWVPGEKWEFMPTGTAILDVDAILGHSGTDVGNFDSAGGTPVASTGTDGVDFSSIGGSDDTDNVRGIIFSPTGKTVNTSVRKYVVVGDSLLLENEVTSTSNYIEITIDLFSGRISYGSE